MGSVRQKQIQRSVRSIRMCVCIALCTIVAHNIAQNRPDNFPPYPPDDQHCSDDVYLKERGNGVSHVTECRPCHKRDVLLRCLVGSPTRLQLVQQCCRSLTAVSTSATRLGKTSRWFLLQVQRKGFRWIYMYNACCIILYNFVLF